MNKQLSDHEQAIERSKDLIERSNDHCRIYPQTHFMTDLK